MKSRRGCCGWLILASAVLIASLLHPRTSFAQAAEPAALRQGTLEVWVPESYVMGVMGDPTKQVRHDYRWSLLLNEFKSDFPEFNLKFRILDREKFLEAIHASQQNPAYPDLVFVDNARELNPLMRSDAAVQMLSG